MVWGSDVHVDVFLSRIDGTRVKQPGRLCLHSRAPPSGVHSVEAGRRLEEGGLGQGAWQEWYVGQMMP